MILLVDDNVYDLELYARLLVAGGFEVATAMDGDEALNFLETLDRLGRRATAEGVVTDWIMPVMDGRDLLLALRQDPRWRDLPVIVVSGIDEKERIWKQAFPLRIDLYLTKPIDLDTFALQVRRVVSPR